MDREGGRRSWYHGTTCHGVLQALAGRGVRLRSRTPGEHRAACPRCNKRRRDDALAVRIEPDGGGAWLCHRCGWSGGCRGETAPGRPLRRERRREADAAAKTARARRLLDEARPARGTLAETYLASRGLTLPDDAPLREHPAAWHHPTQQALSAMVAPIISIETNEVQGAHLTFLAADGRAKAGVSPPRLYVGPKSGGCIKLTPDAEVTLGLAIAEGIETALAGIAAGYPTWACLDAGNLAAFAVLDGISTLTVLADHDVAGLAAAHEVAARWRSAGRDVRVTAPERTGADWATALKRAT